jgi:hypothetical protein
MIMSTQAIEEFGERLVRHVRDEAIEICDIRASRGIGARAERWRAAAAAAGGHVPAEMAIPDCVDSAVAHVLGAMDDAEVLHLSFTTPRGETVDMSVVSWGEPVGWYGGDNGWRTWYSKERLVDAEEWAAFTAKVRAEYGTEGRPDDPPPVQEELPMPRRAIEELGELLVRHVRDVAIRSCDFQLTPQSNTPVAKRWRQAALASGGAVPLHVLIPDCIDETILVFLRAVDQGLLRLSFTAAGGETVDLAKEGGGALAGCYGGWRAKYSKERFADGVADIGPA